MHPAPAELDGKLPAAAADAQTLVFYCLSGMRTAQAAAVLAAAADGRTAYILEGGLQAWKKAGLPTVADRSAPIGIMRQVQIGAGLLTAGLTGFCGMAKLLSHMPWNKAA